MVAPEGSALVFERLVRQVHACRRCPRMEGRTRVLSGANGPLTAEVLFVAEAPGRLGADLSGVPLSGDRTGRTFDLLLAAGGIRREEIFVTNAVLCNPRDERGRNARPSRQELAQCCHHLAALITLLDPRWVVTLGAVALDAAAAIAPHGATLRRDVGCRLDWSGRWLVPLYHPGPRALIHRPLAVQREDYARLSAMIAAAIAGAGDPASSSASGSPTASVS